MAVYTKINKEELEIFLSNYKLGELKAFTGIVEGIENTIYLITTEKGKYILTLYEKRVKKGDLPFFMNLMHQLNNHNRCQQILLWRHNFLLLKRLELQY